MSTDPHDKSGDAPAERPCPECGEAVRRGLVRCWNCGAFMEKKIEAHFQQMQANPSPLVFSQLPEGEAVSFDEDDAGYRLTDDARGGRLLDDLAGLESADASAVDSPAAAPDSQIAHSVATGGDVLLQVALEEQREERQRRRRRPAMTGGAKTPGGFIIFCPYGCKMEVKEQHRGMTGRCPKCGAPFVVPTDPPNYRTIKKPQEAEGAAAAAITWIDDLHVHTVPPEKLKLKADSLKGDFTEVDFGFQPDALLLVTYSRKGGGLFGGGGGGKKEDVRQQVRAHLQEGKPAGSLPAGELRRFSREQIEELHVVQPAASRAKSVFQGIPVFGEGRIAVQLPLAGDDAPPEYVSMGITQFRRFAAALAENYGMEGFGAACGVPMEDALTDVGRCHYFQVQVKGLDPAHLKLYQEDPDVKLELSGWKCAACSLVISEDARQKEKLGGKGGKGLAKVKCPKCQQKFGEQPFYMLAGAVKRPSMSGADEEPSRDKELEPAATASES